MASLAVSAPQQVCNRGLALRGRIIVEAGLHDFCPMSSSIHRQSRPLNFGWCQTYRCLRERADRGELLQWAVAPEVWPTALALGSLQPRGLGRVETT
jgi:hypothetical protein